MRLILSTIGTSLLTHKVTQQERSFLNKYANSLLEDIPKSDLSTLNDLIRNAKNKLNNKDLTEIQKLSAELNGILSYYDNNLNNRNNDYHLLIATDTFEGNETAILVKEFLDEYHIPAEIKIIKGLKTDNSQSFTDGVKKLITYLFGRISGYEEVIFNLTGGFKAIQAYLNTVGMFLADKIIYLFETGTLINIPALPVKFDNYELMKKYAYFFAMLDKQRSLESKFFPNDFWTDVSEIYYDKLVFENQKIVSLSTWGMLMWEKQKDTIYSENLINFPNIEYTQLYKSNFQSCNNSDKIILQACIAELACLYNETKSLLKIKQHGGLQYSDYSSINFRNKKLGHFRITQARRVNCLEHNEKLYLLEYGEHDIEHNLNKYRNIITQITNL